MISSTVIQFFCTHIWLVSFLFLQPIRRRELHSVSFTYFLSLQQRKNLSCIFATSHSPSQHTEEIKRQEKLKLS